MCLETHPPLFSSCQRQREPERDELLLPLRELLLLDELLLLAEPLPEALLRELLPDTLLRELLPDALLRELLPDTLLRELLPLLRDTSPRELAEELPRDAPAELSLDALFAAIELRRTASESAFTTRLLASREATFT